MESNEILGHLHPDSPLRAVYPTGRVPLINNELRTDKEGVTWVLLDVRRLSAERRAQLGRLLGTTISGGKHAVRSTEHFAGYSWPDLVLKKRLRARLATTGKASP